MQVAYDQISYNESNNFTYDKFLKELVNSFLS